MTMLLSLAEGTLLKYTGKRNTERYVFLFDAMMILTKQNTKRSSVTGPVGDYKLKEKYNMRKVELYDKDDTEGNILPSYPKLPSLILAYTSYFYFKGIFHKTWIGLSLTVYIDYK